MSTPTVGRLNVTVTASTGVVLGSVCTGAICAVSGTSASATVASPTPGSPPTASRAVTATNVGGAYRSVPDPPTSGLPARSVASPPASVSV